VAIGLSAGFIEPLESNGLFSVHEFLFKLVDVLQRDAVSQLDRDMYNTSVREIFDTFSQFVMLHYALSHRTDTPYWQANNAKSFASLATKQRNFFNDGFFDLNTRYMNEWGHPLNRAGIPYIATGMHLNMMNEARIKNMSFFNKTDYAAQAQIAANRWEFKKARWAKYASEAPTLYEFLKKAFHGGDFVFDGE
jgi:tryptophan halogenase